MKTTIWLNQIRKSLSAFQNAWHNFKLTKTN